MLLKEIAVVHESTYMYILQYFEEPTIAWSFSILKSFSKGEIWDNAFKRSRKTQFSGRVQFRGKEKERMHVKKQLCSAVPAEFRPVSIVEDVFGYLKCIAYM